jgi:hypothetical protein
MIAAATNSSTQIKAAVATTKGAGDQTRRGFATPSAGTPGLVASHWVMARPKFPIA